MKIGIITFHKALNLGAVLQASALFAYLSNENKNCEIIDYYPNNEIPYNSMIRKTLHYIKQIITFPNSLKAYQKEKKYELYRKKFYRLSKESYYGDIDIKKKKPNYDLLISGSDQILNTTLTGGSSAYYLDFNTDAKKMSYGSSFGRENVSEIEIKLIKKELVHFEAISVREITAGKIIEKECGKNTQLVLDPIFLLDAGTWNERCNEKMKLPKRYIFVYSMEVSNLLEKVVINLQKKCNLPVIVVRGGGQPNRIIGREDETCGPAEFLRYIRDAELVVTNSFHGTAFSMVFHKRFLCIAHSCRNTRLVNIMSIVNKTQDMIDGLKKVQDFEQHIVLVDRHIGLEKLKNDSESYLKNYLQKL